MTEQLIEWLRQRIEATGLFQKTFGLAELVTENGVTYPVIYENNGELSPVHELDIEKGISYYRINNITQGQPTNRTGCLDLLFTYNIIQVATLDKSGVIGDDNYSSHRLIERMWNEYYNATIPSKKNRPFEAQNIFVEPAKAEAGLNVLKTEYQNFGQTINEHFSTSVVKLEIKVQVLISKHCFEQLIS